MPNGDAASLFALSRLGNNHYPVGVLALDVEQQKIYWTNLRDSKIQRASLIGGLTQTVEDVVTVNTVSYTFLFGNGGPP